MGPWYKKKIVRRSRTFRQLPTNQPPDVRLQKNSRVPLHLVQNICSVCFSYLLRLSIFCKGPRDMRKFPQKCQKIAGCWESAVYGSRPPIASKPDSSPLERPDLDNISSQPWSEAICPCTTFASAYLRFVTIFLLEKTRQSTRSGGTGANCVRPWLTRGIV